ncbi:MAG: glycosyltransferase family 4 protein [Pseudomonadota bacterium]
MNVAIIRKRYSRYGGAERYVNALASELIAQGHSVHIYAAQWDAPIAGEARPDKNFCIHRVPLLPGPSVVKLLSFAINVKRLLQSARHDVIHSFERTLFQDIYRAGDGCHREWLIQRQRYESRVKTLFVKINPLHHVFLAIEKRLMIPEHTLFIIANSMRGKQEIIKHYGFPDKRIEVIHNGVDRKRFSPSQRDKYRDKIRGVLNVKPDEKMLLFMGSGFERKGLMFTIQALAQSNNPSLKLAIGGKDNPTTYKRLCQKLGCSSKVIFLGPVKDPEKFYAAADVFILPTIYEPFSNACLEALSCGIPVVTTKANGVSDLIEHGRSGVCVADPSNIESLNDAIKSALLLRHKDISIWADTALSQLTLENNVKKTVEIYERAIAEKKAISIDIKND